MKRRSAHGPNSSESSFWGGCRVPTHVHHMQPRLLACTAAKSLLSRQAARHVHTMNRPRNRQARPPRNDGRSAPIRAPQTSYNNVPTIQQVVPGAAVSIVLKADQPTGREVQGVVQDLLTRGNHPRGIKVRLQDGRVGRVQKMAANLSQTATASLPCVMTDTSWSKSAHRAEEPPVDGFSSGAPPRSLADFMPEPAREAATVPNATDSATFTTASAVCPICGLFEGDELAVSHHVESHLT